MTIEATAGKVVFTSRSNRYAGRCADRGDWVPKEKGVLAARFVSATTFNWVVLSPQAVDERKAGGEEPVDHAALAGMDALRRDERSPQPDPKAKRGRKGSSMGLTVVETWRWCFEKNEERKAAGQRPMTDDEISSFMQGEFKELSPKATSPSRVGANRARYNDGVRAFARWGKPARPSLEYGPDGQPVPEGMRRVRRGATVDEQRVRAIAREEARAVALAGDAGRPVLELKFDDRKPVKVDAKGKHVAFADVMVAVSAGLNVLLVGPAGCGKSHLAGQVAAALKLKFTFNSMSEGVSESALLGRTVPNEKGVWKYQPSPFVRSFRDGGLHLLDEIDAADPNLLVQVNSALANGMLSVPQAQADPIPRHKDFVMVAAANTWGNGADRQYVGRNQLDAATLNRFTMGTVELAYDRALEQAVVAALIGRKHPEEADAMLNWAWRTRERIAELRLRRIMSTRDIQDAAKLIRAAGGDPASRMARVKKAYFGGWSADERAKVEA